MITTGSNIKASEADATARVHTERGTILEPDPAPGGVPLEQRLEPHTWTYGCVKLDGLETFYRLVQHEGLAGEADDPLELNDSGQDGERRKVPVKHRIADRAINSARACAASRSSQRSSSG